MSALALDRTAGALTEQVRVEQIMGLPVSVRVRHHLPNTDGPAELRRVDALLRNVFGYLRRVDEVFSTWRPDSEVLRLRRGELAPAEAHHWICEIRTLCEQAVRLTGGLFCDRLTGPDGTFGWDPTGIVKGWAVERAVNHLRSAPGISFVVGAGGDIICGAGTGVDPRSPLGAPWRIGIEDPDGPGRLLGTLSVARGAVATSGTAARGAHIFDPRTGRPSTRRGSLTVTGPDLTWADVWATTCFVDPSALDRCPSALAQGSESARTAASTASLRPWRGTRCTPRLGS